MLLWRCHLVYEKSPRHLKSFLTELLDFGWYFLDGFTSSRKNIVRLKWRYVFEIFDLMRISPNLMDTKFSEGYNVRMIFLETPVEMNRWNWLVEWMKNILSWERHGPLISNNFKTLTKSSFGKRCHRYPVFPDWKRYLASWETLNRQR